MKFLTFSHQGRTRLGELVDDTVYGTTWPDSLQSMVRRGITPSRSGEHFKLDAVKLEAPIHPGKIIAIGLNYADHAAETGAKLPEKPLIFAKFPSSVIGPGEAITWRASVAEQVDWEAELAVVIGKRARDVSEDNAYGYIFGYTIANDVSARDLQLVKDAQWTRGKSLDTFCPLGPWIVTRDEIPDPHHLSVKTTVNDEVMQNGNTDKMVFNVPQLIAYCSYHFTLEPGDIIITGTPPGVGHGMKPPRYLKDGDVVTISIEKIGELSNPCKVEA